MLEMFAIVPLPKPPSTITATALTAKKPPLIETDEERGPISTTIAQEAVPTPTTPGSMVYVSIVYIRPWHKG